MSTDSEVSMQEKTQIEPLLWLGTGKPYYPMDLILNKQKNWEDKKEKDNVKE